MLKREDEAAERWRMFCAVELPEEVRARAAEHIARLREDVPDVRVSWDRAEKLHITLKFLGDVRLDHVPALTRAAERAAAAASTFNLAIEGAGIFPLRGMPKVLWLGVKDDSSGLALLQRSLEEACAAEGFAREARPFHPHLTLARLRQPHGARRVASLHKETGFKPAGFPIKDLVVIRSELGPGGSRYTVVSRHKLDQQTASD